MAAGGVIASDAVRHPLEASPEARLARARERVEPAGAALG